MLQMALLLFVVLVSNDSLSLVIAIVCPASGMAQQLGQWIVLLLNLCMVELLHLLRALGVLGSPGVPAGGSASPSSRIHVPGCCIQWVIRAMVSSCGLVTTVAAADWTAYSAHELLLTAVAQVDRH
jgi:hypothetical protein